VKGTEIHVHVPPDETGQAWEFTMEVLLPSPAEVALWADLDDFDARYALGMCIRSWNVINDDGRPLLCSPTNAAALLNLPRVRAPMLEAILGRVYGLDLRGALTNTDQWMGELLRQLEAALDDYTKR